MHIFTELLPGFVRFLHISILFDANSTMGSYLSKPDTKVHSNVDENDLFKCCSAVMQGWRSTQEVNRLNCKVLCLIFESLEYQDAHSVILNYDQKDSAFFAVYDGHGGDEVSKYCSIYLPNFVKDSTLYKEGKIKEALEESFLKFDLTLKEPKVLNRLKVLSGTDVYDDIDAEETMILKQEANMPIEEVLKNGFETSTPDKNGETSKTDDVESDKQENKDEILKNTDGDKDEANNVEEKKNGENKDIENEKKNSEENGREISEKDETSSIDTNKPGKSDDEPEDPKAALLANAKKLSKKLIGSQFTQNLFKSIIQEAMGDSEDSDSDDSEEFEYASSEEDEEEDEDEEVDEEDNEENEALPFEYGKPGFSSGTTAIVALIRDNVLYVANIGDSRCVISREGTAIDMSEDHKPEDELEMQRIKLAGGSITSDGRINGGLNLSRAFGDHFYKENAELPQKGQMIIAEPDIRTIDLDPKKDEFVFLACDGIW